jgi:hypothetical protein
MTSLNAGGLAVIKFNGEIKILDFFGALPGKGRVASGGDGGGGGKPTAYVPPPGKKVSLA